jgi:hypothetical protein
MGGGTAHAWDHYFAGPPSFLHLFAWDGAGWLGLLGIPLSSSFLSSGQGVEHEIVPMDDNYFHVLLSMSHDFIPNLTSPYSILHIQGNLLIFFGWNILK